MKLAVGDDFQPVYDLVFRAQRNFPQHVGNLRRIVHNIDYYIGRYNDCMWHYHRKPCQKYLDSAQQELDDLCVLLTVLERAELMGYLSGTVKFRNPV